MHRVSYRLAGRAGSADGLGYFFLDRLCIIRHFVFTCAMEWIFFFLRGVAINIQSIPSTFEPPGWIRRLVFEFSQRRMGDPKKVLEI